jgi:hypothetical protein
MKRPERAPTAVPVGLLLMGLLLLTFESTVTVLFGVMLAGWGATVLTMRGTEFACCLKSRSARRERGEEVPPCATT